MEITKENVNIYIKNYDDMTFNPHIFNWVSVWNQITFMQMNQANLFCPILILTL